MKTKHQAGLGILLTLLSAMVISIAFALLLAIAVPTYLHLNRPDPEGNDPIYKIS